MSAVLHSDWSLNTFRYFSWNADRCGVKMLRLRLDPMMVRQLSLTAPVLPCRYRTFVSEDAGPNTLVATVLAKDPDGDGIAYSITAGNEEGNFIIDSQKGEISFSCCHRQTSGEIVPSPSNPFRRRRRR